MIRVWSDTQNARIYPRVNKVPGNTQSKTWTDPNLPATQLFFQYPTWTHRVLKKPTLAGGVGGGGGVTPNSEGMFRQTNFCQGAGLVKNRKSIWPTHLCRKKSDKDFDRSCCQITITWTWLQYSSGTLHALFQETSVDRQFYFYDILEHTQEQVFLSLWKGQLRNLIFPNARKPPTDEHEVGKKNWFRGNFSVLNRSVGREGGPSWARKQENLLL